MAASLDIVISNLSSSLTWTRNELEVDIKELVAMSETLEKRRVLVREKQARAASLERAIEILTKHNAVEG